MDSALLKRFEEHPVVKDLRRQDEEAAAAERRHLVAERSAIRTEHEKARPALVRALDAASAAARLAHTAWRKAADEAFAAEAALADADHAVDAAVTRIDGSLRTTAPPSIAAFVAWLDGVVNAVRREPPLATVTAVLNFGDPPQPIGNNYAALGRWIVRAVAVRNRAENLALESLDDVELEVRFAELREELGPVPGKAEAEAWDPSLADTLRRKLERTAKEMARG